MPAAVILTTPQIVRRTAAGKSGHASMMLAKSESNSPGVASLRPV